MSGSESIGVQEVLATKRDGGKLSPDAIRWFVDAYTRGGLPDYQAAAWLMAVYLRGMSDDETAALTAAMADSGARLDLSSLPSRPVLDKHSTGGVGDKASLIVVPILAACGVPVCKMSGRGLGHTGGTLDKLESIPGFRVDLSADGMRAQVRAVGACLAGQTDELAPADKKLYALRDATGTVGSLPLIVSSILSKKLAGGADAFLFDVKVGSGALLRTEAEARELAGALVRGARAHGRRAVALLTDMDQPLGEAVGNALEVAEAVRVLTPGADLSPGTARLRALSVALAAEGFRLVGRTADGPGGVALAEAALSDGRALARFRDIVAAQHGDPAVVDRPGDVLPAAPVVRAVLSGGDGYVARIDAAGLGTVVATLGGGRSRKDDAIDPRVGLIVLKQCGDRVAAGETLLEIHAASAGAAELAASGAAAAYTVAPEKGVAPPVILGRITG